MHKSLVSLLASSYPCTAGIVILSHHLLPATKYVIALYCKRKQGSGPRSTGFR